MTKKNLLSLFLLAAFVFLGGVALAQENITYPIDALGGCNSREECKTYCDDVANIEACVAFGESHGLMRKDEASRARQALEEFKTKVEERSNAKIRRPDARVPEGPKDAAVDKLLAQKAGPGGCTSKEACREYCEDEANMDKCLQFAADNGLMSPEQIEQAKKFANKTGPGGCKREACKTYCEDEEHAKECIAFAEENGFITKEEAEQAKNFIGKTGPGGCKREACKTYCDDAAHIKECMSFAVENGFITQEEADRAGNLQETLRTEAGPGGCQREECKTFCDDPAHREDCKKFAQVHGFGRPEMERPDGQEGRQGETRDENAGSRGEDRREMNRGDIGTPPCNSPEECRKMFQDKRGELPERQRGEEGQTAPAERRPSMPAPTDERIPNREDGRNFPAPIRLGMPVQPGERQTMEFRQIEPSRTPSTMQTQPMQFIPPSTTPTEAPTN